MARARSNGHENHNLNAALKQELIPHLQNRSMLFDVCVCNTAYLTGIH